MYKKPTTIKELCEFIWYLEEKYNLLDFETDGVKVWQYKRMEIYYKIAELSGVILQPHTRLKKIDKIKHLFVYIKNSFINNFFTLKRADTIVFSHPRVVDVDNKNIDIYTYYLINELKKKSNVIEFESANIGIHKKERTFYTHYLDWVSLLQRFYKVFHKVSIIDRDLELLYKVKEEIDKVCSIDIKLIDIFRDNIKNYKSLYKIYDKIFKRVKPSICYTVNAYGQAPIIKALKDNKILVVELQHGVFSKYHLGYSFPNNKSNLEYFPDKLYVWSKFWKDLLKFPISNNNIVIDKFRYLEQEKSKFIHLEKNQNQIIVLSQGAIGDLIAQRFLDNYSMFKNYTVKYKLHPGEFDRWKNYTALVKLSKYENIEIIKDEIPLYELFAKSSIQVGVFSTALYEGIEFGCKTILFNISGIEYMDRFIEIRNDVDVI